MEVFVAIWEDRHSDTEALVFTTADLAIEWAKKTVRKYDRHGDLDETLTKPMKDAGWVYHGCYSCEGDHIYVLPAIVDGW